MDNHEKLVQGLGTMGLAILVTMENRLPMLNSVKVPESVDEAAVRSTLLKDCLQSVWGRGEK